MSYMANETDKVNEKGAFINENELFWYIFRRLCLREYFLRIIQLHFDEENK